MGRVSVVINTINEERNISRAIASVKGFADEIVVVDMHSDDKTVEIAKKLKAKVYEHERTGYVEPARNFAISKASGKWILILDADEEVSGTLVKKLNEIVKSGKVDFVRLPRKNYIFKKWIQHSRWWPDYNIRFFKKGTVDWSEVIHSVPMTSGNGLDLEDKAEFAIIHHHYENVEDFITKLNNYTTRHATNKLKDGYEFVWSDLIKRPVAEFLSRYFAGEGYRDGLHGLALSLLQAFSELVLYMKIWGMQGFEEKEVGVNDFLRQAGDEARNFRYWENDYLVKTTGGIMPRVRRKLKI